MTGSALPPIGERLREARLQRGMTVRGLAREIEVSASLISQIETGKSSPSVSTLYAITGALNISIEDVFGGASDRAAGSPNSAAADKGTTRGLGGVAHTAAMAVPAGVTSGAGTTPVQRGLFTVAEGTTAGGLSSDQAAALVAGVDRSATSRPPKDYVGSSTSAAWGRWCHETNGKCSTSTRG